MSHTPKIRIDYTDSLLSENDLIDSEVSNQENKLDDFADQIINAFIVKKQERLIDKEENEDNLISYKESEIRLIYLGIFSAFLLGIITMFNAFKHQIILKSEIPDNFYFSGTILRVGHFVMIFGGTYNLGNVDSESDWPCSSIPSNLTETVPSMVIWNIKRQVWLKGPYIPTTTNCIENSSGFAVNRSHGV